MAEERVQRRLAAILVADVVGYSRLMEADEPHTLERLKTLRREIIEPTTVAFGGRIFKITGDGALAEFPSAAGAVETAVEVQRLLAARDPNLLEEQRITLRIGISLGDVMVDGDDLYGNGVNVAARMETMAEPGGICISGNVHEHVRNLPDIEFEDLGEQTIKNIDRPVHAYRVLIDAPPSTSAGHDAMLDRPAIAVLPFDNLSGDPEQEYFVDGLTEDIITALSLWRSFPVIARNSTFTYKGRAVKVQEVAEELGARYVLEGSVRRDGRRVRVAVQLVDAKTGHHVWAERYDRDLEDIFDLQDELTQGIAANVAPELERAEQRRLIASKPENLDAWEYFQRGMARLLSDFGKDSTAYAREMFERAIELDPGYSRAYGGLAYSLMRDCWLRSAEDRDRTLRQLLETARHAVTLDDDDWFAHFVMGLGYIWDCELEKAIAECETALILNPNNADNYASLGHAQAMNGDIAEGIRNSEKALHLNPRAPNRSVYMTHIALAYLIAQNYEGAIEWANKSIVVDPGYTENYFIQAAGFAYLGHTDKARQALDTCQQTDAQFIENWAAGRPYINSEHLTHCLDGLRKAGWEG